MESCFLNIDLELVTRVKPSRLLADLGDAVSVLNSRPWDEGYLTTLEIAEEAIDPESTMEEFRRILGELTERGRREWSEARKKEFNFGFEAEEGPEWIGLSLGPKVISMIAETGASFGITVYRRGLRPEPPAGTDGEDTAAQP